MRLRLGGAEALGGDEVAPRRLLAHRAHDVRADRRRQQAEARFAEREVTRVGDDADVAHRGEAEAAGVAVAVDAADHRHRAAVDRPQHLGERRRRRRGSAPRCSRPASRMKARSAPAQNALPLPPRTMARTPSSPASAPNAAASSRISVPLMALRTSGRSSQTRADRAVAFDAQRRRHDVVRPSALGLQHPDPVDLGARVAHRGDRRGDLAAVVGAVVEDVASVGAKGSDWAMPVVGRVVEAVRRSARRQRRDQRLPARARRRAGDPQRRRSLSSSASSAILFDTPSAKRGNQSNVGDQQMVQGAVHALEEEPASLAVVGVAQAIDMLVQASRSPTAL